MLFKRLMVVLTICAFDTSGTTLTYDNIQQKFNFTDANMQEMTDWIDALKIGELNKTDVKNAWLFFSNIANRPPNLPMLKKCIFNEDC